MSRYETLTLWLVNMYKIMGGGGHSDGIGHIYKDNCTYNLVHTRSGLHASFP